MSSEKHSSRQMCLSYLDAALCVFAFRFARRIFLAVLLGIGCVTSAKAQTVSVKLYLVSLLEASQFLAPATLQLKAFASDPDGIQKVEFFSGGTLLGAGSYNGFIYTLNVPNVGVGTYSITAKSTDNLGNTKVTAATNITVKTGKVYGFPGAITPVPLYTSLAPYGYNEYLPTGYDPNNTVKKWPLVVSLHGNGGQPGFDTTTGEIKIQNLNQAIEGVQMAIIMDGLKLPAVVLHPQSDDLAGGWNTVDAFITYALGRYNVDPNRVYLTGHSWGGNGAWAYAGGRTSGVNNATRLAALFPLCGGGGSPTATKGNRMANLPTWTFHSYGDQTVGSIATVQWVNYIAAATCYNDAVDNPNRTTKLFDLLYSFSAAGYEKIGDQATTAPVTTINYSANPAFIPAQNEEIDAMRTVSYDGVGWDWQPGQTRNASAKLFLTFYPANAHIIWRDQYAVSDLWTWVFQQTRAPGVRTIFKSERFAATPAVVNKAYAGSLTTNTVTPNGRTRTFSRDATGPAWLSIASDGTLVGTPSVADTGLNTWNVTVTTTDASNTPVMETAELLMMVEAPGYNTWWQKQNGNVALGIPAIASGPAGDDDGDGQSNYFEYVAGLDPLSASSNFKISIAPQSGQRQITFGPLVKGVVYTVKSSDSLAVASWTPIQAITGTNANAGQLITVVDANTVGSTRFYTVEIGGP